VSRLKFGLKTILLIGAVTLVVACSSDKGARQRDLGQPPLSCPYKQDAIQLSLKADSLLNLYDNAPHTLSVCFYQLKDPNVFKLKSKHEDGLYELMECSLFDASVTNFERVTVQPGKDQSLTVDRAEGSNYLAMVAGYYGMEENRIVRFLEIPVETKTKILTPWKKYQVCLDLSLEITLGPQQIERIENLEK
jgi:type VI secretion system VasD/TssJ family lipoprotein